MGGTVLGTIILVIIAIYVRHKEQKEKKAASDKQKEVIETLMDDLRKRRKEFEDM